MTHFAERGDMVDDIDSGSGMGSDDIYRERTEPVLDSLPNLYCKDEISVDDSRPSSCPAYIILLTISGYCLNPIVYDFDLRRSFYSK